jgi:hypothetical protein
MSLEGLRRFARASPEPVPGPAPDPASGPAPAPGPVERCDLCAVPLDPRHGHVVSLDQRSLRCACRPCYLLFTRSGAGGGRFRAVPDRYLHDPAHPLTDADWDELGIPVSTAFLFDNSDLGRTVACYPSPAGATECLPDADSWDRLRRTHPLLAAPEPDVEAVFVSRPEAFLVPIDACYALVGEVRTAWRGIDGGPAVHRALAAFVADLRRRSRPLRPARP